MRGRQRAPVAGVVGLARRIPRRFAWRIAMRLSLRTACILLLGLTALSVALPSLAGDRRFDHRHPRRDQVLDRTQRQNHRITHEVREGDLTHAQAHALRLDDRSVRHEQRADARANGGYITRREQKHLNRQLNANSKLIGH
jgi:hypothetical protein